jgi:hypothetical protein
MTFSDFLEDEILDHIFKTGAYTAEANLYIALCISTPGDDDTSDPNGEVTGTSYVRIKCNTWDTSASGATENTQTVAFAQAGGDWGTVTHFAICDETTTGNMIAYGKLDDARVISSGDTASFATGALDVTLT